MKDLQKGFVGLVIAIIIGLVLVGGGTYVYLNKVHEQKGSSLSTNSDTSSITDPKDVIDFDTCMSYAKNIPTKFDIVFLHGSDIQEIRNFALDFKTKYPKAEVNVFTEQDALDEAVAYNGGSIKTASGLVDYKKQITPQLTSKISVSIPLQYLGKKKSFDDFISTTLNKYPKAKFQQYAGSSPETFLSDSSVSVGEAQYIYQQQCDYKYNKLNASERASADIKAADQSIQLGVQVTMMNAMTYYDDNASYASGSLKLNNGICSDAGVYGLKKYMDNITKIAGTSYCYASATEFAVSAPLKSDPTTGYCTDSTGFFGKTAPTAASKGYCVAPKKISQDISACKNSGATVRERWICVGNIVDPFPPYHIQNIVMPFATPIPQKIDFCKTFSGVEADYCFASIIQSQGTDRFSQEAKSICNMISDKNLWFKEDCKID